MDLLNMWNQHASEQRRKKDLLNSESGEKLFKEEKHVKNETHRCKVCRDTGIVLDVANKKSKKCSACNSYNILNQIEEVNEDIVNDKLDELNIPDFYKGKEFNPDLIKSNVAILKNLREDPMMELYIRKLKHLHNHISSGIKLENSFIIMAPQGYSKSHFVYCSIESALKYGYSVAPYLDTEEWLELKIKEPLKFKEYLKRDVLFIKLLPAYISVDDTQMMKYIVDKRARLNLPTIVTSRFNTSFIHSVELHLENNIGLVHVDKYDYSKLKEITGIYPKDYTNLVKKFELEQNRKLKREQDIRDGKSKIHDNGILSNTDMENDHEQAEIQREYKKRQYDETYSNSYKDYYNSSKR